MWIHSLQWIHRDEAGQFLWHLVFHWSKQLLNPLWPFYTQSPLLPSSCCSKNSTWETEDIIKTVEFQSTKSTLFQLFTYIERYFSGNFKHRDRIASTTTILNSSAISDMKLVICLMRRSTLDSLPVLRRVVIARVAILLFWSDIKLSKSTLQFVTARGRVIATCNIMVNQETDRAAITFEQLSWRTMHR